MKMERLARACAWPTNSDSSCGRSAVSPTSSLRRSGVTMREGGFMRSTLGHLRKQWPEKRPLVASEAAHLLCEVYRLLNIRIVGCVLAVLFVGRQARKAEHRQRDVTRSFGWQKVAVMD